MVNWYFLIVAIGAFAILRIAGTGNVDAKYFRDIFLIITFILLGMTSNERRAIQMMVVLQAFVVAGILLEAVCLPCYNDLFAVKDFYINTRGLGEEEFTNLSSDLYVSATRPEARFLPFFDLHRMSSVFLEPVSLGNFMTATVAFTAAFWNRLGGKLKMFFFASMILMLLACDGRLAAMASVAIIAIFSRASHDTAPCRIAVFARDRVAGGRSRVACGLAIRDRRSFRPHRVHRRVDPGYDGCRYFRHFGPAIVRTLLMLGSST